MGRVADEGEDLRGGHLANFWLAREGKENLTWGTKAGHFGLAGFALF